MKFPVHVSTPDGHILVGDGFEHILTFSYGRLEDKQELVRRANAFDELLEFLRRYVSCGSAEDRELYERLTKYEVPGTEDKA